MERVILHSDCNNFYASVECLHRPEIRGKPVAVTGDAELRHGIILAKNYAAKKYGIQTGEPIWAAQRKCPGLVLLPANFPLYLRFSRLCRQVYMDYTEQVESFGLDEAWLDVTGSARLLGGGLQIAEDIRKRIKYELGITVSIGVSYNKIFAKLGSDIKKPDAITVLSRDNYKDVAWPLPVEDLLYVGRATKRKLNAFGVRTIGDLAGTPDEVLRAKFGKWGDILWCFANGLDSSPVAAFDAQAPVKSVGNSTTTPRDLVTDEDVKIIYTVLVDSVARRMREQGFAGRTVTIHVRDNQLYSFTRQCQMERHTDLTGDILRAAMTLFRRVYHWTNPVRSVGVSVSDLVPAASWVQTDLFCDEEARMRRERLDKSLDWLKSRFGSYCVRPAVLLTDDELSRFDPKAEHTIHPVGYF